MGFRNNNLTHYTMHVYMNYKLGYLTIIIRVFFYLLATTSVPRVVGHGAVFISGLCSRGGKHIMPKYKRGGGGGQPYIKGIGKANS